MKKILAIILLLVMLASMAACGSTNNSVSNNNAGENSSEIIVYDDMKVIENELSSVEIKSIQTNASGDYVINAALENKSPDKTIKFSLLSATVNDVYVSTFMYEEIAAGNNKDAQITVSKDELESYGIAGPSDIELELRVYENYDWNIYEIGYERVHLYPYGKDKAVSFERKRLDTDTVLFDDENVTVILTGCETDPVWGYSAKLYIEDKSDKELFFRAEEVKVNGIDLDPNWSAGLEPGKKSFSNITWSESTLNKKGISSVSEIEMLFRVYDCDSGYEIKLIDDVVKLNP